MIHIIGPNNTPPEGVLVINTTSRSTNWSRALSPFFLGPVKLYGNYVSSNVENGWQYSKVYEYYCDDNGHPSDRYFRWAEDGWAQSKANRYPMGKGIKPLYSYWDGKELSYTDARKEIYVPMYSKVVESTYAFKKLKHIYQTAEEDIYLWDFDAHGLQPGTFDYWALLDNPNIKVGHAYVLAMMLENKL